MAFPTTKMNLSATRCAIALLCLLMCAVAPARDIWTAAQSNLWYARQPWMVGANYIPASAINQLEMWQPQTFDAERIDRELGWAEWFGMNTMRVFLHDLLWQQDAEAFKQRIAQFLQISSQHHMRILSVLFDIHGEGGSPARRRVRRQLNALPDKPGRGPAVHTLYASYEGHRDLNPSLIPGSAHLVSYDCP